MNPRLYFFTGSDTGAWRVTATNTIFGDPLPGVKAVDMLAGNQTPPAGAAWLLRGVTSNDRYVQYSEKARLLTRQPVLGRSEATLAALIPIRKSNAWWTLTQDERRQIFEEDSAHIKIGMKYLPEIARRLHHCRDLTTAEPFDFLTWFEFAPAHVAAFDDLLAELRDSREWRYVERECDIRLEQAEA
jgi:hypothetical protein